MIIKSAHPELSLITQNKRSQGQIYPSLIFDLPIFLILPKIINLNVKSIHPHFNSTEKSYTKITILKAKSVVY